MEQDDDQGKAMQYSTREEMNIDTLFGLIWVQEAAICALIQTHPDCERLLAQFNMQLQGKLRTARSSGRTRLEEAAATDYGSHLRKMIAERADGQIALSKLPLSEG